MFSLQTIFGQGKQFYALLDEAADAAHASTRALHDMLKAPAREPSLDAFKLARQRERDASAKISSALYKIPKQVERFADRYALARHRLDGIDFAPRAAMLEKAASVVVEMVKELRHLRLEPMKQLNDRLRVIETEADRLILELHRDIYSGRLDAGEMFLLKEFFEILEKAIDRCREAGVVAYEIALKNS
jgi:uncharacterized protein Yka (UPF0111/DUF47 family)